MYPTRASATLTALAAAAILPAVTAAQEDEPFDRTPRDCIILSNVEKTEVVDDNTILFYMRGRDVYRNHLPRRCPNLAREDRFSYRTTSNRLCDIDTITVLEQFGTRLQGGFTCQLGQFHPITEEEVDELLRIKERGSARDAVEAEAVELPAGSQGAESGASEASPAAEPSEREGRRSRRRR